MNKKTVTVFGSSLPKEGDKEFETAYRLGRILAHKKFNVCTGGYKGIMDAVSKGATEKGGEAIGVTVGLWHVKPSSHLTKEIRCHTLFDRVTKLFEIGDAYVILQGGTGTLLELAAVWEFMNKNLLKRKPIACHSKMWKDIITVMDNQIEKEKRRTGLVKPCKSVEEIADYLVKQLG